MHCNKKHVSVMSVNSPSAIAEDKWRSDAKYPCIHLQWYRSLLKKQQQLIDLLMNSSLSGVSKIDVQFCVSMYVFLFDRPPTDLLMHFSGGLRGASIIDSLDTLYIMGLLKEYNDAKEWVKTSLDLTSVSHYNCFHSFKVQFDLFVVLFLCILCTL